MWKTAITKVDGEKILIRGYDLLKLMESFSFGDLVLLMITAKMPSLHQGKLMEAILVSCCDQGPLPPSTNAARFVASCGVPLQAAVAAGVLGFGQARAVARSGRDGELGVGAARIDRWDGADAALLRGRSEPRHGAE